MNIGRLLDTNHKPVLLTSRSRLPEFDTAFERTPQPDQMVRHRPRPTHPSRMHLRTPFRRGGQKGSINVSTMTTERKRRHYCEFPKYVSQISPLKHSRSGREARKTPCTLITNNCTVAQDGTEALHGFCASREVNYLHEMPSGHVIGFA